MTATSSPTSGYLTAPNRVVSAANGIDYAYRQVGDGTPALVLLQHFRGNLDNWDPALVDALTAGRRVVAFDNVGVGAKLAPNDAPPPAPGDQTPPPGG
jgi:pimeloyl-ACP methyl ester carboxylesterase